MDGGHYASHDIEAHVEELFSKWEELLEATDSKRLGLEQALSLVHFNRKVRIVWSIVWRRKREERERGKVPYIGEFPM